MACVRCLCVDIGDGLVCSPSGSSSDDGLMLYRVKSCPDIVDQLQVENEIIGQVNPTSQQQQQQQQLPSSIHLELQLSGHCDETRVRLRVHSQSRQSRLTQQTQQQRYSCGALDHKSTSTVELVQNSNRPSPCSSAHNSNPSLNANGFSIIQVS